MREINRLRQRLLLAMGIVGVGLSGCGTDQSASGADVASETVGDGGALVDSGGDTDDAAASDVADAGVDGAGGDAVSDVVVSDVSDAVVSDASDATVGASADAAIDTTVADTADGAGDASADADLPMDVCSFGKAEKTCFTAAQLAWAVDNKWGGGAPFDAGSGDAGDADASGPDYPVPPEGCPAAARVFDGCCNPAEAGPLMVGDTCCYVFCAGGCCGRPLLVGGVARMAEVVDVDGWAPLAAAARDADAVAALDAPTRRALADAWASDAAMEHASIASFQRFGLELLRFGAPASLCAEAARAVSDEIDHAERTFALASLLADTPRGPGALDLGDAVALAVDLEQAVVATIAEGCVGETFAAALADAAGCAATAAPAREALAVIAADETRHAELAWRFVRWAIEREPSVAPAAARAFADALAVLPEAALPAGVDLAACAAWGRLGARRQRAVVAATVRDVIAPCARALLGDAAADALPIESRSPIARA